jgi:hypothetical protein
LTKTHLRASDQNDSVSSTTSGGARIAVAIEHPRRLIVGEIGYMLKFEPDHAVEAFLLSSLCESQLEPAIPRGPQAALD